MSTVSLAPRQDLIAGKTAFVGVSVLPMSSDTLLLDQTVLVEAGVVTVIGPPATTLVPSGKRVIAGRSRVLMPGLADMHVHLDNEADLRRYLEAGVKLVRNMRGEPRHLQWRAEIAAGRRQGPRIITTGPTLIGAVRVNPRHVSVTNAAKASQEVRAQTGAGYDLIKVHSGLSTGLLAMVGAVADSTRHAFVGHLMDGGLKASLNAHQASIEHVDTDAWTEGSTPSRPSMTVILRGTPPAIGRCWWPLGGRKWSSWRDRCGTPVSPAGHDSRRRAQVYGRHGASLAIGSAADLILVPADPRVNLGVLSRVQGVMIAGRWLDLGDSGAARRTLR